jgi:hypothetical protein
MIKPLLIALVLGMLSGCAELPLHDPGPSDLTQVANGEPNVDSTFKLADYRTEHDNPQIPVLLAGGIWNSVPLVEVVEQENGHTGFSAYPSPSEVRLLPAVSDSEALNPSLPSLPPDTDQRAPHSSTPSTADTQQGDAVDGAVDTSPHGTTFSPAFADLHGHPVLSNLLSDEANFYRCGSLEWLAIGLGTSAIFANTHIDEGFRDAYGESLRPANMELDFLKEFGNGEYVIPSLVAIWLVDYEIDSFMSEDDGSPNTCTVWLQEWSGRSLRGLIVGAVPLLTLQYAIGSGRPSDNEGSQWRPFKHDNGASGHAFVGAIPFWTAAQMTDCCTLDVTFYAAGTLAGWSRIHTDSHYLSQVLMGWWLAGLSVSAVNHTELQKHQWYTVPTVDDGGAGIALIHLW